MEVRPEKPNLVQEIGDRDRATWRWRIVNHGARDSRLVLAVQLLNKNGDSIPLIQTEELVLSSNVVRQVRDYLQPIPLALGAILGSLIVCIAGLFRRGRHRSPSKGRVLPEDGPYGGRKEL